jgi:O-acetyl-ADP-ribose deacetylase (regulator of RNase III)
MKFITGSALDSDIQGNKVICHIVNSVGLWGSGFVVALSKKWKEPEQQYRDWFKFKNSFELGNVGFVQVTPDTIVANMIAQHETIRTNQIPIRYDAVEECLNKVAERALETNSSILMPRIGCGLAQGKWSEIEKIVKKTIDDKGIHCYVFTLDGDNSWK